MGVIDRLKRHILVDGFHVVVDLEKSQGSWIVDAETGARYLDCYSQFASQPLGWNYLPFLHKDLRRLHALSAHKLANPDMYTEAYADFVEAFAGVTPDFCHYFFVEGGSCGVENALKAAFDWKCQTSPELQRDDGQSLDVVHLREAFHGRTGYALSLTNTGDVKTKWFPKFPWTRIPNPKTGWPRGTDAVLAEECEAYDTAARALRRGNVAAVIVETIQGEGGDNHFRPEFLFALRELAHAHEALLIFDEVQCGMGLTGRWWAYEHFGVKPDLLCFGKKAQVCGFCSTSRIESAPEHVFRKSGRINSTFGGSLADMERCRLFIEVIRERDLVAHAAKVGAYFLQELRMLSSTEVTNVRGRGLMIAFDLPTADRREAVLGKMHDEGLLALRCGERSIRFRPALTFSEQDVDDALYFVKKTLA